MNLCCIIAYFSKRKYRFLYSVIYMNHQSLRFISLDFLSSTKIQYKETNYDAENIDNNK